ASMSAWAITRGHFAGPAPSVCSNASMEISRGLRKLVNNGLRGLLAAANTIRNPDPAIRGARQRESRPARGGAFYFTDSIKVTPLVLWHRIGPALNLDDSGSRRHREQSAKFFAYRLDELVVGQRHHLVLQNAAHESTHQNRAGWSAALELKAG